MDRHRGSHCRRAVPHTAGYPRALPRAQRRHLRPRQPRAGHGRLQARQSLAHGARPLSRGRRRSSGAGHADGHDVGLDRRRRSWIRTRALSARSAPDACRLTACFARGLAVIGLLWELRSSTALPLHGRRRPRYRSPSVASTPNGGAVLASALRRRARQRRPARMGQTSVGRSAPVLTFSFEERRAGALRRRSPSRTSKAQERLAAAAAWAGRSSPYGLSNGAGRLPSADL